MTEETTEKTDTVDNTEQLRLDAIRNDKELRVELDTVLQKLKDHRTSRNRALAITHVEDAIMRLGMDLKELGTANPYPNSYKPENPIVDPTADGLKL